MRKEFEIFGGLIILFFMGVVLWQMMSINSTSDSEIINEPKKTNVVKEGSATTTEFVKQSEPSDQNDMEPILVSPTSSEPDLEPSPIEPVACTMDAKMCPDGSYVGRIGPNCEFAACPGPVEKGGSITCSPESKLVEVCTMEYAPVCGLVEVQCITTPCDPVPQTFGNACGACAQGNVASYTEGACETEQ